MKQPLPLIRLFKPTSFTLVELLVVMGIIAILAGILIQVGTTVVRAAKRASAQNAVTQIQTAVNGYYTEYGIYPVPFGAAAATDYQIADTSSADGSAWAVLVCSLSADRSPSTGLVVGATTITNAHGIAFLSFKQSDVYSAGTAGTADAPKNPIGAAANLYFNIAMDSTYDGVITPKSNTMLDFTKSTVGNPVYLTTSSAQVAVWENCNIPPANNPNFWVHTY